MYHSKKLTGKVIQLEVRWKGGSAVINSKIPEFFIKHLKWKLNRKTKMKKKVERSKEQEKQVKQSKQELNQERVNSEVEEEPVDSEVVGEQSNPEDEDK